MLLILILSAKIINNFEKKKNPCYNGNEIHLYRVLTISMYVVILVVMETKYTNGERYSALLDIVILVIMET